MTLSQLDARIISTKEESMHCTYSINKSIFLNSCSMGESPVEINEKVDME